MSNEPQTSHHSSRLKPLYLLVVITILIVITMSTVFFASGKNVDETGNDSTFVVKNGPLHISVIESGTIKAREQVIIKSEVEGRTTILSLVPEGTIVKKGELLVELDVSQLVDNKIDQQIKVQNADAAFIRARENLAVVKNQALSDKDQSVLTLEFAKQDLEKYLQGEYPSKINEANARITLAEEELQRAEENLDWSKKLFDEKYLSQTELQADQLAVNKKKLDLNLAKSDLDLLENFTYKRNVAQYKSDVKQAEMALERINRKAAADVVQAKADLLAKESELKRQKDKLEKIEQQIVKTKIFAPENGLVIYATSAKGSWRGNQEPLQEGEEVREREELIYLPTSLSMTADVKVHESSMKKVSLGLPVTVTVDAIPGNVFTGQVAKIAPLPDAQSVWLNPDLKVYNTQIHINEENKDLRTGMSCKADILIEAYDRATYIPIQAVIRVNGQPTVYVKNGPEYEPRAVEIGLDNNRMVIILDGLEAGEVVLLTPPLKSGTVEDGFTENQPKEESGDPTDSKQTDRQDQTTKSSPENRDQNRERKKRRRDREGVDPQNVSPEEAKKMKEKYENMTPEEKEKMRRQFMQQRQQDQ